jgi:asparagine synthetase B (glutamine-hydrolysing)
MQGGPKGLLRRAFRELLPDEVVRRPKQNFQAPVIVWLSGRLGAWARPNVDALGADLDLGDLDQVRTATTPRDAYALWSLALFQAWRSRYDLAV